MEQQTFYLPGDLVIRDDKVAIILGSYALLNSKDMDFVTSLDDHRFHDYRIIYLRDNTSPLTYVRDTELKLVTFEGDPARQILMQNVMHMYEDMISNN